MMTTSGAVRSEKSFRRCPAGALTLALVVLGAIGCGSSSSSSSIGPAEKFLGRWELDTTTTTFSLNCPALQIGGPIAIWGELNFDHGVLSDLTETSGNCLAPGVDFDSDSKGTTLTAPSPDPYTSMPPECDWFLGNDANGPVIVQLSFTSLTFTLLSSSGANMAPSGLLAGTGSGPLLQYDANGVQGQTDSCTYAGTSDRYHQMTRP